MSRRIRIRTRSSATLATIFGASSSPAYAAYERRPPHYLETTSGAIHAAFAASAITILIVSGACALLRTRQRPDQRLVLLLLTVGFAIDIIAASSVTRNGPLIHQSVWTPIIIGITGGSLGLLVATLHRTVRKWTPLLSITLLIPTCSILTRSLDIPAGCGSSCVSRAVTGDDGSPEELSRLSRSTFEVLAQKVRSGPAEGTRQVLFAIDRNARGSPSVTWINTRRYPLHVKWFGPMELAFTGYDDFVSRNYRSEKRRWILGSLILHPETETYAVEMWEGDTASATILNQMERALRASFDGPIRFTPTSDSLERSARKAGLDILTMDTAYGSRPTRVLRPGRAVGTLRIIGSDNDDKLLPSDIVILLATPVHLDPVGGIITTTRASPLSHVNMLADAFDVPNAYVRDAGNKWRHLEGRLVSLDVSERGVVIEAATATDLARDRRSRTGSAPVLRGADLSSRDMMALSDLRREDANKVGAKAANLGAVTAIAARNRHVFEVPPGFAIPFSWYRSFVRMNGIDQEIAAVIADPKMSTDRDHARRRLAALRTRFDAGRMDPALIDMVRRSRASIIGDNGVFARSSTNAEDLPRFNGAGLYTSVPNLMSDEDVAKGIRTVWGSIWNDRAWFAREAYGIRHADVYAGVLIQRAMPADTSGVLITAEPGSTFGDEAAVSINAKVGLGQRVVEGDRAAEQLVYHRSPTETIRILGRSDDEVASYLRRDGGVSERRIARGSRVLTTKQAILLGRAGNALKDAFGTPQDVEWLFVGDRLWVVQSRPYLGRH